MQNAQTNFGALWNGSPQFATKNSLLSTSAGLNTKITTTSNVLQGEIDAIVAGGTTALWANYKAIKAVDLSGNNLSNANTITATSFVGNLTGNTTGTHTGTVNGNTNGTHTGQQNGNVSGNVVGNLSNASLTLNSSNSMSLTNDRGSDVGGNSVIDINANYGAATRVNINANAASAYAITPTSQVNITAAGNSVPITFNPIGGKITLTANAGTGAGTATLGYGEIDLTAYSAGAYAGVIKLSAGANMIYSGTATPYFGLYGQNTIYGLTANSLIAGTPPALPTLVGTNYFYGALGIGGAGNQIVGNRFQGGVGIDFLQPYPNGDLIIQSNANGTDTVVISGVKSMTMSNGGNISGVGNINLNTINNAAYPPVSALNPVFNSVSTNQLSTGASFISSINGLPMSAYTNVGDAVFNSISTNQLSTGASFISSINGLPMSAYTNVGDATFNSISASKISTARISISSINDSIYFGNLPTGNSIAGIYDLQAATGTFNTSLTVNGSLTAGNAILGGIRGTSLFRITNGSGFNVATIDTAGAITGTSLAVSGAISGTTIGGTAITGTSLNTGSGAITGGVGSFTNITASGSATVNNKLTVVAGGAIINGATNIDTLNGVNLTYTTANLTTATIPTANITNTNTGVVNAGAGSLALTYGSITFNGSPYAPTAGTSADPTFNSISTSKISTAQVFLSSLNGVAYVPITTNPTFNSISTSQISTAQVFLSSINGVAYVPGGSFNPDPTFNSISTGRISTGTITANFISSQTGEFDILNLSTLLASQITTNTLQTAFITGLERLSLSNIVGNSFNAIYPTNNLSSYISSISLVQSGFFNFETNAPPAPPSGIQYINSIYGVFVYPAISPVGTTNLLQQNVYIQPGYAGTPTTGSVSFYAIGSSGFLVYFIQQGDGLNQAATPYTIQPGYYVRIDYVFTPGYYQNATYTVVNLYTPIPGSATSTITTSKVDLITDVFETVLNTSNIYQNSGTTTNNLGNLALNVSTIAFGSNTTRNNTARFQFNGAVSMPSLSTTQINASQLNASSINVPQINASSITGCLYNNLVSTITSKTGIPGATQQLLNAAIAIYSPVPTLDLTQLFTFSDANYSYWNNNGFVAGNQPNWFARIETLVVNTSATLDFYIGDYAVSLQIGYSATNTTYIGNIASGFPQKVRFYFSGGTWYFTNTFTPASVDNFNSLTINQNISQTSIQTTDALILSTSLLQIYGDTYLNNLTGKYFNVSTMSSLNTYTGQINANALNINSIAANAITTNSITTGSITTGSIITNAPLTVPSISTINMSTSLITAANFIASTRITTPSISTLKSLNGFNTKLLNNPGNVLVFTQRVFFGNGSQCVDINTDQFVPGVYTCVAVCEGNVLRTLEATLYYNSRTSLYCNNANGFDNYNGQWWYAYTPGFVRFTSQTDGGGDTFDIAIYMVSGQYTAIGDDPPFPFPSSITATLSSINTGTPSPLIVGLSTMTGSTITIQASENLALIAGLSVPTFLGNGTVAINASTNVDLMANVDITFGAAHDIKETATHEIRLTSPTVVLDTTTINAIATNVNITGAVNMITGSLNMANHNISSVNNLQVNTINSASYPPPASVVSSFTQLYTSSIAGNPNYLSLTATRSITLNTSLSTIVKSPATYFSGDVRVSSLNGAAVGGGGGGGSWVGTATSALNMGTYPINGSALTINSSNSGDFNIKTQRGSGAALNLTADNYMFFQTNVNDMYFNPNTDIGGNAPGSFNFGGNNFYANSYQAMYFTNYGTSGYGMNFNSSDRLLMYSATQLSMTCSNLTVDFTGYGGVSITDSSTGGTGILSVDSANHLYWNGTLIA
jgi:hypothetical protein